MPAVYLRLSAFIRGSICPVVSVFSRYRLRRLRKLNQRTLQAHSVT